MEMPSSLPASPPPTEAPPPNPASVELIPEVILDMEPETQESEVSTEQVLLQSVLYLFYTM